MANAPSQSSRNLRDITIPVVLRSSCARRHLKVLRFPGQPRLFACRSLRGIGSRRPACRCSWLTRTGPLGRCGPSPPRGAGCWITPIAAAAPARPLCSATGKAGALKVGRQPRGRERTSPLRGSDSPDWRSPSSSGARRLSQTAGLAIEEGSSPRQIGTAGLSDEQGRSPSSAGPCSSPASLIERVAPQVVGCRAII